MIYIFYTVDERYFCNIVHNYSFLFNINYIERTEEIIIIIIIVAAAAEETKKEQEKENK